MGHTHILSMNNPEIKQIGLLLCDDVDPEARDEYGSYDQIFQNAIDPSTRQIKLTPIRCYQGEPLPSLKSHPHAFDGYLISGSRYSVYENKQWIKDLIQFVSQCWDLDIKVVGICFGHQLIAHALGGKTEKAGVGWGFGIHTARITEKQPWMTGYRQLNGDSYNLIVIHQDQVVTLPKHFKTIASHDFCPNSMIVADDKMLGIQGHPELSKAYCENRARERRHRIGEATYQAALASLSHRQAHGDIILGWIRRFFS